jgi:predicted ATPase
MTAYREGLEEGLLRRDERQEATVRELQRLYDELTEVYPTSTRRRPGSSGLTLVQASPGTNEDGDSEHQRPWWRTLFSSTLTSDDDSRMMLNGAYGKVVPKVRGLYMFGGVGCGKTMLMDLFAACAPNSFKVSAMML